MGEGETSVLRWHCVHELKEKTFPHPPATVPNAASISEKERKKMLWKVKDSAVQT